MKTPRPGPLSVLAVLAAGLFAPLAAAAQGTADEVGAALSRLGHHPPPSTFGEAEEAEAQRLHELIDKHRIALLMGEKEPSDEELARASAALQPTWDRLRELSRQRREWAAYQTDPAGEWWRAAEPDLPELVASAPVKDARVDVATFHMTAKRLQILEYFLAAPNESIRARYGYPAPDVAEAVSIARALEPFEQGRIEVGGQGVSTGGIGCFRLRAGYLRGRALTLGAFVLLEQGRMEDARALWRQAIDVLHRVEVIFKLAVQTGVNTDSLAHLPAADAGLRARLQRAMPQEFIPLNWDDFTHRIGLAPGGMSDSDTATETARLLEDICPWSPPVVALLEDLGQLSNLDLRVLRGPEIGTQHRNGIALESPEKVWIGSLGPAAIPPNVGRDLEQLRNGIVPNSERYLAWRSIRGTEQLAIWVVSPRVRDMQPSEFLTYASKALTLSGCGAIAIAADIAGDILGKVIENVSPNNTPAQVAVGVGAESVPYEVVFDEDGGLAIKREGFNPVAMIKGALLAVLSAVERAEIEALFDGLDPTSSTFDLRTNQSISYAGGWVPPIILRAIIAGWEDTDATEYPRLRLYTRYWVLDPAGLTRIGKAFNLEKQLIDKLPGEAALRAGNVDVSEGIWKPLPWAKTPDGWGSRARTVSLQPMTQTIRISVPAALEKEWRADCPAGQDLCVVLRYAPPFEERVDYVPLGKPFQFCDPGYAKQEGLPLGFEARRLFASYDAHIVRAKMSASDFDPYAGTGRPGPRFDIDAPEAVELAHFPLRFTPRRGAPVTGKLESDEDGLHPVLSYLYEGRPRPEFDLEPDPTAAALLPGMLEVRGPYREEGEVYKLRKYYDRFEFSAAYVPAEANEWYRLNVQVIGAGGSHDMRYSLHDLNRDVGGAAVFHGNIPVPIGPSEVHLTVTGLGPPVEHTAVIEREPPSDYANVDLQKRQMYLDQRLQEEARAKDEQDRLYARCQVIQYQISLAEAHRELEQWGNARLILHEVADNWPDVGRVTNASVREQYEARQFGYLRLLADVSFHQGDVATMGPAGANVLAKQWEWTERDIAKYGNPPFRYGELEEKYARFIDDYLSLGGGEVLAHLLERWNELRRLTGKAGPEDARRFKRGGTTR